MRRKHKNLIIPFLVGVDVSCVVGSEPLLLGGISLLGGDVPLLEVPVDVTMPGCDVTLLVEGVASPISKPQEKVWHYFNQ